METERNSTSSVTIRSAGVRFGLISALCAITYFLILNVAGIDMTSGAWSWLGYLITALIVIFAHKYYKDTGDGFLSYGQGVGIAFWIGLVSGAISSIFTYLYIKFVDTTFMQLIEERQIQAMQEKGLSEEQIDQAMKFASMFNTPEAMFIMMLVGSIITAVIIGVIVTIFTQKKDPEPAF